MVALGSGQINPRRHRRGKTCRSPVNPRSGYRQWQPAARKVPWQDMRARSITSFSRKPEGLHGQLVFPGQGGAADGGVVGAQGHLHPGVQETGQGVVLQLGHGPGLQVGGQADLQVDPVAGQPLDQFGILPGAGAVADAVRDPGCPGPPRCAPGPRSRPRGRSSSGPCWPARS